MRRATDRDQTQALYEAGVAAVVAAGRRCEQHAAWGAPACGEWDAADTARHLLVVAEWYGQWLDRSLSGTSESPCGERELDRRNREAVGARAHLAPVVAIDQFAEVALAYLERAERHLDHRYAYPFGTVTVALHLGVAAAEWHLHAWDLDRTTTPADPQALFLAAGRCVAATKPAVQRAVLVRLLPLGARRAPWSTMLRRSGRRPGTSRSSST